MQITIYVNKRNAELFGLETGKSKLINNLLERHYFDTDTVPVDGGKTQEGVLENIKAVQSALDSAKTPSVGRYVATPDGRIHGPTKDPVNEPTPAKPIVHKVEAKEPLEMIHTFFPKAKVLCKIHGIPMTTQGKCLQKGCKYA